MRRRSLMLLAQWHDSMKKSSEPVGWHREDGATGWEGLAIDQSCVREGFLSHRYVGSIERGTTVHGGQRRPMRRNNRFCAVQGPLHSLLDLHGAWRFGSCGWLAGHAGGLDDS